ncbi:HD domain-containing protein [Desulfovibrio sp. OttesenSCG-928-C14]|nr:HD domain-containing protein [Desulfovibrio sp. OttesenSCG-928-C14]
MQTKRQRIRDPLHDLIEFSCEPFDRILWRVIQTPSFQRLRRVKQLGFSEYVYPGATHTRFSHCLGAYHIAKNLLRVIRERSGNEQFNDVLAQHAIAAALVHDVGHGPFSHAFEDIGKQLNLKMAKHEDVSDAIIRAGDVGKVFDEMHTGLSANIADLIRAPGPSKIYGAVVSSQFDADRLDYMQRDRLMTGTQLGRIDLAWLMTNLEIGDVPWGAGEEQFGTQQTFVLGAKSIHAAEAYVLGLFQLYPTVYLHKATRGAEKLFTELLLRIFSLVQDGGKNYSKTNLPKEHPLIVFAKKPNSLDNALSLDDTVIMGALPLMAGAKDPLIQDFSQRLQKRILYKCLDVRERLLQKGIKDTKIAIAVEEIRKNIQEWSDKNQVKDKPTRILIDSGKREPYKRIEEEKGPLNQIMINTSKGKIVDINEQSAIIKAIRPFEFFRVYTADEDSEAKIFIENAIKGVKNGKKTKK